MPMVCIRVCGRVSRVMRAGGRVSQRKVEARLGVEDRRHQRHREQAHHLVDVVSTVKSAILPPPRARACGGDRKRKHA
tara:strand:+ start:997 stop:1230 length:234 start_codon:yes stop_codon:yes gene_type:complete